MFMHTSAFIETEPNKLCQIYITLVFVYKNNMHPT